MKIEIYEDGIGSVELIDHMGTDLSVVNAARVSFGTRKDRLGAKDEKLIKYLMNHRHTSPFEHCSVTFRFVVPLFVRSQHHRHRTWSYNEWSARYRDMTKPENKPKFYEPTAFRTQHKSNRQASNDNELIDPDIVVDYGRTTIDAFTAVKIHNTRSIILYEEMIKAGICREQARGVLPQSMYTEYYGTVNLLNALKFVDLRTHEGAQWEIRQVASAILEIMRGLWPVSVKAFEEREWK